MISDTSSRKMGSATIYHFIEKVNFQQHADRVLNKYQYMLSLLIIYELHVVTITIPSHSGAGTQLLLDRQVDVTSSCGM